MIASQSPVIPHFRLIDVISMIRCSDTTLRHWIRDGKFPRPVGKIGVSPVWSAAEVEAWADSRGIGHAVARTA